MAKGTREDLKVYRQEEKELVARLKTVQEVIASMERTEKLEAPKKPKNKKKDVLDEAPQEEDVFA